MSDGLTPQERESIRAVFAQIPAIERAILFGSRAMGVARSNSDVDITLVGASLSSQDILRALSLLEASSLPYQFDLILYDTIKSSELLEHIRKYGKEMYMKAGKNKKLGDILILQRGFDLPSIQRKKGTVPIISSSGISGSHNEARIKKPGVVTGRYGTIGSVYYIDKDFWPLNTTLYVKDFKNNHPRFIYYLLKTIDYNSCSDKAAVPGVNRNDLHQLDVNVPPLPEQQAIAHVLGTLDDKIELNRRQNATLEAMAQAIFKDWFVDFGPVRAKMEGRQPEGMSREIADLFPDRLDDEGKPEGWEWKKLGDLITFYSERIKSDKLTESNYVSTENMLSDKKGITKASSLPTTDSVPAFCTGHILVSNIRPYFKKIWFATFDGGRSNDVLDFCPLIVGTNYFIFNILICDAFFDFMMQTAKGSKMPRGDKNAIMAYSVVAPTEVLQRAYSSLVEVYYKKINNNVLKNEVLTSLRDTLLPKLISGELRVPDAEKMVADIV